MKRSSSAPKSNCNETSIVSKPTTSRFEKLAAARCSSTTGGLDGEYAEQVEHRARGQRQDAIGIEWQGGRCGNGGRHGRIAAGAPRIGHAPFMPPGEFMRITGLLDDRLMDLSPPPDRPAGHSRDLDPSAQVSDQAGNLQQRICPLARSTHVPDALHAPANQIVDHGLLWAS
jgi:hypothetical protein